MGDIHATLAELGLNDTEIEIYLALIKVGTAPASALGQRTGITRSTAQYSCQQLAKKNIVTMVRKDNTNLFTAETPERLMGLLERQQKSLQEKEDRLQKVMGSLKQMMNVHAALPKVQFYEGNEGIVKLYDSILDMRKPIDSFEESGKVMEMFPEYGHEYMRKRIERKIFNRCVAPAGSPFNETDPERFIEVRTVDQKKYPFTWHIKMCDDTVGMFSFEEGSAVGIGIRHKDIAFNFHLMFQLVWDSLDPKLQRGR
jgi:sugar-specific transcriptional regulator TrmB